MSDSDENDRYRRYPQTSGMYNYSREADENQYLHTPPAAYNTGRSEEDLLDYYDDDRPSNIFNTSHSNTNLGRPPPGIDTQNPFGEDDYEMGVFQRNPSYAGQLEYLDYPAYQGYHGYQGYNQLAGQFDKAFVPHAYDDEDEDEFDRDIQFNNIEGDHFDLQSVFVPEVVQDREIPETETFYEESESPFSESVPALSMPPAEEEVRTKPNEAIFKGVRGHLVLDCPLATELLSKFPGYDPNAKNYGLMREFSHMRYTAVTCGPSNFWRDGYILRPIHYPVKRETELMIVITMYNEDDILLARTLKGVFKNIKHFESRTNSPIWGKDSWKKIVVCVVSDGRSKINERAQALLAALGVYQEGLAKSRIDDKKVKAHIYEYSTKVGISEVTDTVKLRTEKVVPVQMMFCLKEDNTKKINSHRWCFEAFSQILNPNVVVLLDCGTQPSGKSLYKLWKEFDRDPQVAGACGEIKASLKKKQILTNPLVYGQNFEYKISNILDKPTESVFGFISVLPGAFSAYRYVALQNDANGRGPLEKYFKGEFLHGSGELDPNDDEYELKKRMLSQEAGIFTSNMYLAEDRILCYELVAKRGCAWLLRYVKSASAETDVPEGLAEFILQRRRWLNGSFFAAIYSLVHFPKVWSSLHSFGRKLFLHIEFFYQFINLVVSWFSIGSYFLVFRILTTSLSASDLNFAPGNVLSVIFLWLYLASIVTTFVLSFGNTPKGTEKFYVVIVLFFAILMVYMIFAAIFMAVHAIKAIYDSSTEITVTLFFKNAQFRDLVVATSSTYALYFLASFLYLEPWHMFTSFIQYLLLSPAYVNVLNIYAFCNIDDISWGTKGDTGAKDLGVVKRLEDGNFKTDLPVLQEEINQSYLDQLNKIKKPIEDTGSGYEPSHEDYYAFIRSMTVLIWMFTNGIVVALVLETGGFNQLSNSTNTTTRSEVFLTVILWTVAFMALFRFIGCITYLIRRFLASFRSKKVQR
ncbi:CIC11C00000004508 [Sungouiella intermedia]|uniref:Chitin synthase n=1 Tax=Sungouiella intermedia TaxID=45354 RepID=A0A1L0GIH1_9ASCO|nr:CIC11C00000004508 [[Candida] intermedia]